MLNTNDLLKRVQAAGADGFNYRKLGFLLKGVKGTFTKKDIQIVRKIIRDEVSKTDKLLSKLENQS